MSSGLARGGSEGGLGGLLGMPSQLPVQDVVDDCMAPDSHRGIGAAPPLPFGVSTPEYNVGGKAFDLLVPAGGDPDVVSPFPQVMEGGGPARYRRHA